MGVGTHQHNGNISCERKMVDTNNYNKKISWIMSMCSTATIQFMNKIFMDD